MTGITDEQTAAIKFFMQGAVYCWVKNRMREPFAVHDLMGGENFFWHGTPLIALYDKHATAGRMMQQQPRLRDEIWVGS